jgi:hypothetical protein
MDQYDGFSYENSTAQHVQSLFKSLLPYATNRKCNPPCCACCEQWTTGMFLSFSSATLLWANVVEALQVVGMGIAAAIDRNYILTPSSSTTSSE